MDSPPVGSLVVPAPDFRSAMGTGEGAALLLALRRGSGHLYYPSTGRGFWVPLRDLRAIPMEAVPRDSLEALLSELLLYLEAEEVDVSEGGGGQMEIAAETPGISHSRLRGLEAALGSRLADLSIEPGGRHAIVLRLRLVSLPAGGAGSR
jgi:hypothetical protein